METRVDDKVAVVTGASRGIGESIAIGLLDSGARGVVMTSRTAENVEAAAERIGDAERVHAIVARADSEEDAHRVAAAAVERFGSCDILVNNAGTNPAIGPLMDVDMGAVDKTWEVNQRGPLLYARAAWHASMHEHGGVICNVASVGGIRPGPGLGAYNVSKAALIFLTQQLANELAPTVRVVGVAPAVVKTKLSALLWQENESETARSHPLGRLGEPRDVANAVVFLCSDQASWMTGITLEVDGGVTRAGRAF